MNNDQIAEKNFGGPYGPAVIFVKRGSFRKRYFPALSFWGYRGDLTTDPEILPAGSQWKRMDMFRLLFVSASSACFELDNKERYYAPAPYEVFLNGAKVREGDTNVFSLFGLNSDTEYNVTVQMGDRRESMIFRTRAERFAINVRDFGAQGDGVHDDTKAIRAALDFLPEGGRLYFPEGTYLTFPQAIRSHMTIEFAEGAVLLGSPERARYQIVPGEVRDVEGGADLIFGAFEGEIREMYQALLSAAYAEDITIIGPGTVDGNARSKSTA